MIRPVSERLLMWAIAALCALTLVVLVIGSVRGVQANLRTNAPVVRCEEDQQCWNCATMGNRICGQP